MEIAENIYEGVVEPYYQKKTTISYANFMVKYIQMKGGSIP